MTVAVPLWIPTLMHDRFAVATGAGPLLPVGIARVARWFHDDRLGTAAVMSLAALPQIVFPAPWSLCTRPGCPFSTRRLPGAPDPSPPRERA